MIEIEIPYLFVNHAKRLLKLFVKKNSTISLCQKKTLHKTALRSKLSMHPSFQKQLLRNIQKKAVLSHFLYSQENTYGKVFFSVNLQVYESIFGIKKHQLVLISCKLMTRFRTVLLKGISKWQYDLTRQPHNMQKFVHEVL